MCGKMTGEDCITNPFDPIIKPNLIIITLITVLIED